LGGKRGRKGEKSLEQSGIEISSRPIMGNRGMGEMVPDFPLSLAVGGFSLGREFKSA